VKSLTALVEQQSVQLTSSQKALVDSSDEVILLKGTIAELQAEVQQSRVQCTELDRELCKANAGWADTNQSLTNTKEELSALQISLEIEKDQFKALQDRFDQQQQLGHELKVCLKCTECWTSWYTLLHLWE
jgi:predicted  nucleic acid-binding Zn-ribbon protein